MVESLAEQFPIVNSLESSMTKALTSFLRQILRRGCLFLLLSGAAFIAFFGIGILLVGYLHPESSLLAVISPTWLDVGATACVALTISLLPSSRLRFLPVWVACTALTLMRVWAMEAALAPFSFGPGAYPTDVWANTVDWYTSSLGIAAFLGIVAASMLAAVPRSWVVTSESP